MNILEFNTQKAKLNISLEEMLIFKNALTKTVESIPDNEFKSRMNLSRGEVISLKDDITKLLQDNISEYQKEFTYEQLLALNSSLNEICYRIFSADFEKEIGHNIQSVKNLLKYTFPLTQKMIPDTIKVRIIRRTQKLFNFVKPYSIKLPRSSQIRKECTLIIGNYRILFLLFSLQNSKTFSGIKIVVFDLDDSEHILFKTIVQKIKIGVLGNIISYFDEYIDSIKNNTIFEEDTLFAINPNKADIFEIKVLSGSMISEQEGRLEIGLKLNISDEENINNYFDVQAPVSFDIIHEFTSAIKEYLIDTVHNDAK